MKEIYQELSANPEFKNVKEHFIRGDQDLLTGISGTQKSLALAGFISDAKGKFLVISYNNSQATRIAADLEGLLGSGLVAYFPSNQLLPHEEAY